MNECNVDEILKQYNLKITNQRIEVLKGLIQMDSPFTASDLKKILNKKFDTVTIYRILNIFLKKGVIREISTINDAQYYELACFDNPLHPHLICEQCHKIFCLDNINKKDGQLLDKYAQGFFVFTLAVTFKGLCSECKEQIDTTGPADQIE